MTPICAVFVTQKQEAEIIAQGSSKEVQKEVGVVKIVEDVLCYTNNLKKAERILSRVVAANGLQSLEAVQ